MRSVEHVKVERCACFLRNCGAKVDRILATSKCGIETHAECVEKGLLHGLRSDVPTVAIDEAMVGKSIKGRTRSTNWDKASVQSSEHRLRRINDEPAPSGGGCQGFGSACRLERLSVYEGKA